MKANISKLEQPDTLPFGKRLALCGLAMVVLLSSFNISVVNVALPDLANTFSVAMSGVQWLTISYLLAMTLLMPVAGMLGDRFGRKSLVLKGLGIFLVGTVGCVLSDNLVLLIAARAIQGVGAALLMSLAMSFVSDLVPSSKMGSVMGLLGTTSAVGTALGPVLGGVLISHFHWNTIFYVSVPVGILAYVLLSRLLPHSASEVPSTSIAASWVIQLQQNHHLLRSCMANFLVSAVIMSTMVVGPFYLSNGLQLSPEKVGLLMAIGPIVAAIAGAPAGQLTDRKGAAFVICAGLISMIVGCLSIALSAQSTSTLGYMASLVLITAGYAMFQAANNTAVMKNVKKSNKGITSALLNFSRNSGLMTGASVMGWVYMTAAVRIYGEQNSSIFGFTITFLLASGLVAFAMAGIFMRKRSSTDGD